MGSSGWNLRKTRLSLLVPSLSLGTHSLIFGHLLTFNCSNFTWNGKRLEQTVNSEEKNILEPFSKELNVVLLYYIKTVVSHLKTKITKINNLFLIKMAENHTVRGCTYPYSPYKGVHPLGGSSLWQRVYTPVNMWICTCGSPKYEAWLRGEQFTELGIRAVLYLRRPGST